MYACVIKESARINAERRTRNGGRSRFGPATKLARLWPERGPYLRPVFQSDSHYPIEHLHDFRAMSSRK
jgi:hypothetical protein